MPTQSDNSSNGKRGVIFSPPNPADERRNSIPVPTLREFDSRRKARPAFRGWNAAVHSAPQGGLE